jgi:radical SAM superfamily enzyme YgiQ (UPF0313 family)
LRILLIAPTALDFHGRPVTQRRLHLPGLSLPALAAVTPPDHILRIVYETIEAIPYHEKWDLVGLTGMGSGIVRAWQIADRFRERGIRVVIGGIAASLLPPGWTLAHADILVIGEAEELWPRVLDDILRGMERPIYRMVRPPNVDVLPLPRYDLMNRSRMGFWRPVQATRGCPFQCRFCSVTAFFGGTYRKRPVRQVIENVRAAKKFGSHYIAFIDDNIAVDFDYCRELWEALIPEKIIWMSQCSLHITEHPDLMRLAHKSGCRMLSIGIESTAEESLWQIDKSWNRPARYSESITTLRSFGIEVSTEMIIGLDGDDTSVFRRTLDFIMANRIAVPRVHIITPVPGTPLFDQLRRDGRILSFDISNYTGGKSVFKPKAMSPEELQEGYWDLYANLFSWRSIVHRIVPNPARLGLYMRAVVWAANLKYKWHICRRISPGIL